MSDSSEIAFKVLHVDWIEADDSDVQTYVGFGEFITKEIFPRRFREHFFKTIKRLEKREDIVLICFLSGCKSTLVHTKV